MSSVPSKAARSSARPARPSLHNGRLYLVNDNTTQSFIAAFDARTGRELWRTSREEAQSWATPFVWENALRTEIVTASTNKVRSYDLDGRLLWELKGMTILATPSPFAAHGLVYISSGYPGQAPRPVYAIRPGASGDISLKEGETSNAYIAWYQPLLGTYNTSALVHGDYYYTLLDRGFLLCHDARTGKQIYGRQRHLRRVERLHVVTLGLQREGVRAERGRRYVCRAGRPGIQDPAQELAERDDDGNAGDCAEQPDHQDAGQAVSHCAEGAVRSHVVRTWIAALLWGAVGLAPLSGQTLAFAPVGSLPVQADTVELQSGLAYVASGKTFTIFDVSKPSAPKKLGSYTFPEEIWSFRLQGQTAYVGVNFFGLGILDVSSPSAPVLRGSFKTPGQAKVGAVFGTRALVVDHMEGIVEVDITNPAKMLSPGSFFLDGYARDVVTSGSIAFAVDSPTGFYIFDLAKKGPLEPIATMQNGTALRTVDVSTGDGPRIAVLVGGGTLQIYDVSNVEAPARFPPYRTPGGALRVALKDRLAYVADGAGGVTVVDLATPGQPTIVGTHKTATAARDVAVSDGLVLVAVANGDVIILSESK